MKKYIIHELFDESIILSENELFRYYNEQSLQVKSKYPSFKSWIKALLFIGLLTVV